MTKEIAAFILMLKGERGLAANTCASYRRDLESARQFFVDEGLTSWATVDRYAVLDFLTTQRQAGKSSATINRLISSLRQFFKYLIRQQLVKSNPMETIDHQPVGKTLQKPLVLNEGEVERLLHVPDTKTPLGVRDRAILELLDATGMRVTELVNLPLAALHLDVKFVQLGGRQQERMVPLSRPAVHWLKRYLI